MRVFSTVLILIASHALAQVATVTDVVTVAPPSASATPAQNKELSAVTETSSYSPSSRSTTSATSSSTMSSSLQATSTSSYVAQATSTFPPSSSTTASMSDSGPNYDNGGDSGSGSAVDTNAGASGSDQGSSFSLSKGGLIAIILVVALVAIFGIASTVLFVMAKRRQWDVRGSIARVSRRLTGRFGDGSSSNRRVTVNAGRLGGSGKSTKPPSHKRGLVVEVRDLEKGKGDGPLVGKAPKNTRPRENTWVGRLWGNDWK